MGVSPYLLFLRKHSNTPALKKLPFLERGKALGKMYKALPTAEKAALVKAAKNTPSPKHSKIRLSVRVQARKLRLSAAALKQNWKKTEGEKTTADRLKTIAKTIAPRVAKKAAAVEKVAKKAAKK